ncbi:NAD(P)-dependent oxidoreductase [Stenotrophomonas maltophilia]|uniref:NAD(P)-dependent oxidoreductase n=1 Tax=Stenotrophomonas maltophilia TaxID=40324 RepID=UPI0020975300|nr:NAD(P)-dependent oxidoreductase [Stenotrophomonas maltophilia]MCO7460987.1 NAD(P)-dependent oxidoreductase [Stenotrophomonas maltophilia]HEL2956869.1 NAD(P)-dependent oxidoreductase [Stenotrophomonas maltophilia]HEL4233785.1 NAD(P)-dependent oxidoreductase [Stenotrophomonas maltophilia]
MPLGFIGLGVMGTPMAGHLARAGHAVLGWSRSGRNHEAARTAGVQPITQRQDVFDACGTILLMLANDEAIDSVLDRNTPTFPARVKGRLVINMGTSSAAYSQALGEQIRAAGGRYVEAPVSGSRVQAEAAQLVIMLAGDAADVAEASHLLAPLGRQCVACGQVPAALRMKLAVNLYLITLVTALGEAVHFAEVHGIALERFAEVLNAGPMASEVSRIKLDKMIREDFAVQASITDVLKNSGLVAGAAHEAGMQAPLIDASDALFARAQRMGLGGLDMAAVLQAIRGGPQATSGA